MITQQDIENIPPNIELSDYIRENMQFQMDQNIKNTLLKESLMKASLDKDFKNLFEPLQQQKLQTLAQNKGKVLAVSPELKGICSWLEESEGEKGLAYCTLADTAKLIHLIHQKVEGTAIVIAEYPNHWISKMEEISRLNSLKWGFLSSYLQNQQKVRILELYELKKLKVLFIAPSLLKQQTYHEFDCDLTVILDTHLYLEQPQTLNKLIMRCHPERILAIYQTLMVERYEQYTKNGFELVSKSKSDPFRMIVLKSSMEEKFRMMTSYVQRNECKRILILVNKRQQASQLYRKFMMESKAPLNLFEHLPSHEISSLSPQELIKNSEKSINYNRISEITKKISMHDITISKYMDFLRFCTFDVVVFFSFGDVGQFIESCPNSSHRIMLFSEDDYYNCRNSITAELFTEQSLQSIVANMIERPPVKQQTKKRCYSQTVNDKVLDTYSLNKQYAQKFEQKVLKMNMICKRFEIQTKRFQEVLQCLVQMKIIQLNYRTIFQIDIDVESMERLRKEMPQIECVRRKVNLLNLSSKLQKTISTVLEEVKDKGIKYRVSQEAFQIRIMTDFEDIDWEKLFQNVNRPIISEAIGIDRSFEAFNQCAYGSIELTKRQKSLKKKAVLLNFCNYEGKKEENTINDSFHKSNLLTSEIEEWLRHGEDREEISEQDLVLILQGVDKARTFRFKEDPVFGRYRKIKYEELMESVRKTFGNKKLKNQ